jgi:hypothetical protein
MNGEAPRALQEAETGAVQVPPLLSAHATTERLLCSVPTHCPMTKKPQQRLTPRLIRPEKDGQEGEWSYLFHANGHDYIFPALVNELGHLKGIFDDEDRTASETRKPDSSEPILTKVIYWKASEWETKFLPLAVEWFKIHRFTFPKVPYIVMEFRKIEDRDGENRITEVVNVAAIDRSADEPDPPTLLVYQFKEVGGEEGKGRKPLMQWWMQGTIRFEDLDVFGGGFSVPCACSRLARWAKYPDFLKKLIHARGASHIFKLLAVHGDSDPALNDDELRIVTMWIAFCLYINSLKTTYVEGLPGRRRSEARDLEEALALEQATILKSAGILRSGVQRKPVATGTGSKHRYRYLVRGHERIVGGKVIWVKPQIRGEGEFMVLPTATSGDIEVPAAAVKVMVPKRMLLLPAPVQLLLPAPRPPEPPVRPSGGILSKAWRLLTGLFRLSRTP